MQIFTFHSRRWNLRALTADASGSILPAVYAPWIAHDGGKALTNLDSDNLLYQIMERHGFFLTSIRSSSSRTGPSAEGDPGLGVTPAAADRPAAG